MSADSTKRRLSPLRLLGVAVLLPVVFVAGTQFAQRVVNLDQPASADFWFAPYVDVTLPPTYDFQDPAANPSDDVVLAFLVASHDEPCTPSWGASVGLKEAATSLDLDRRIARLRERGGDVALSFGGVANDELANVCTDPAQLASAYSSAISRYDASIVDLDLEGASLDEDAVARRATAFAELQAEAKAGGHQLEVWLTLPVDPHGLPENALASYRAMVSAGVDVAGVNLLTMDYAESRDADVDFVSASIAAIDASAKQLVTASSQAGHPLTLADAYRHLGVTPMIGQNDTRADRLDTDGARDLLREATDRGVTRFSMWSLNRDVQCGANVDPGVANNSCSGVDQTPREFASIFSDGSKEATATRPVTAAAVTPSRTASADATGAPFATWRPRREYDESARVVWDGEVYQAKWWNVGAQPDAPVEHEWDSPWRLLGPVMPEDLDTPPTTTLPPGVYPDWDPLVPYNVGDRVEHYGVAYRAKWWTRGDDPSADYDNTWQNAWEALGATRPEE